MSLIAGKWGACETAPRISLRGAGFGCVRVGLFLLGIYVEQIGIASCRERVYSPV